MYNVIRHANAIYSNKYFPFDESVLKYRLKFIFRSLFYYRSYKHLMDNIKPDLLEMLFILNNRFLEKPYRPYMVKGSSSFSRANLIVDHYHTMSQLLSKETVNSIYSQRDGLTLASFEVDEVDYRIRLLCDQRYQKEGDMTLAICANDTIFYAVSFIFAHVHGQIGVVIGGIQGPSCCVENNERIKKMTRKLYGQRPKNLMINLLALVAQILGVEVILAVRSDAHIYQAKRYQRKDTKRVKTNYTQLWEEVGGSVFNGYFYSIPVNSIRKCLDTLSRSKRSMYRQRYNWLDTMKKQFTDVIKLNDEKKQLF